MARLWGSLGVVWVRVFSPIISVLRLTQVRFVISVGGRSEANGIPRVRRDCVGYGGETGDGWM